MNLANRDDVEKLIEACIRGDRKSQQQLYQAFYGKMLVVCMRYASGRDEAQDFLHDGFLKVFAKLGSFKNEGSLEGWIRRIIVNNTIDFVRKKKEAMFIYQEESHLINLSDTLKEEDEAEIEQYREIQADVILKLVQNLTPAYRTVFNMYVIEDYSHKEIAETLNISIGSSKSNLAKAKMKLREMFKNYSNGIKE
ncbi:MAG: RNA polymerase sigma factor [Bacteroidia bacterium]|nr:RNA polymerase sigma factor [Bacteroidia bacterium]